MDIGDPYFDRSSETLVIPLIQDFSGNRRITVEPTLQNTGLQCVYTTSSYSWDGLNLVTEVMIRAWAEKADKIRAPYPYGCDEVKVYMGTAPHPPSTIKYRVVYRDSRFSFNEHLIGEFSL